jgi:hypothetical protein
MIEAGRNTKLYTTRPYDQLEQEGRIGAMYLDYPRHLHDILPSGSWYNRPCFILGGGESLKGFDYGILDGRLTIGTNKTLVAYEPTILYMMDVCFAQGAYDGNLDMAADPVKLSERWRNTRSRKVMLSPMNQYTLPGDDVWLVRRLLQKKVFLDIKEGIYGGTNSGFGAMMLAVALGANPVFLLGMDMKAVHSTHCHAGYDDRTIAEFNNKLTEFKQDFIEMTMPLDFVEKKVINLNTDAGTDLHCFPVVDPEAFFKRKVYNGRSI